MFTAHELTAAYLRLQRQPKRPDDRVLRFSVGLLDGLLHLLLLWMLFWLLYVQFLQAALPAVADDAVQVHWITRGDADAAATSDQVKTEDVPPSMQRPRVEQAASLPPALPEALPEEQVDVDAEPDVALVAPVQVLTVSQPDTPLRTQPLRVTELPAPMPDHFQLPPPTQQPKAPVLRDVQLREAPVQQAVESMAMRVEAAPLKTLQAAARDVPLKAHVVEQSVQALDMFVPSQTPAVQLPEPAVRAQALPAVQPHTQVQALPMRQPASAASPAATAPPAARPALKSSQWMDPSQRDDWGLERRDTAGAMGQEKRGASQTGDALYHRDGSVRLPDEWLDQNKIDLDLAGAWLERPGLEYRGTRFDRYWIPQGTLLQEWVRRGIKQLSIPIPGTSLKLMCVVSLLQVGGGCMPVNPNVNEQPATGRPPPDIPFKPELQEDNGSVKPR